jgi:hypothetical protein
MSWVLGLWYDRSEALQCFHSACLFRVFAETADRVSFIWQKLRCGIIRINLRPGCHGWSWCFLLVVVGIQQYHLNCCVAEYFSNSCLHVVTTTVGSIFVFCKCVIADGYDSGSGWLAVFKGLGFRALAPTARHSISNHKKRVCLGLLTILWISLASWLVL